MDGSIAHFRHLTTIIMPEKQKNSSSKHKSTDRPRASAPVGGLLGWLAGERGPEHRKSTVSSRAKDNSNRRHPPSSASKGKQPVRSAKGYQAEDPEREGQGGHRVYAHTPANPPRPVHSGSQVQVKNDPTSSPVRRTQAGHSNIYAQKLLTSAPSNRQATGSGARARPPEPLMSGAHQAQHQPSSAGSDGSEGDGFSATSSTVGVWGSTLEARAQTASVINDNSEESGFSANSSIAGVWGSKVADRDELRSDEASEEPEEVILYYEDPEEPEEVFPYYEDPEEPEEVFLYYEDPEGPEEVFLSYEDPEGPEEVFLYYEDSERPEEVFVYNEASDQDPDIEDSDPDSVVSSDVPAGVQVGASITNADQPQQYHNINAALNDLEIKDNCCLICRKRLRKDGFSCPGGCGTQYHNDCVSDWRIPRSEEDQEPCPCPVCGQDIFQENCVVCGQPIGDYEFCCPQQCGAWLHEACVERWIDQCRESHANQNMPCPRCGAPWPKYIPEQAECPICLVAMDENLQNVTPCPALCKQDYHTQCINRWLEDNKQNGRPSSCPKCRAPWP
ncbi:hypothetical protein BO99DRAFT_210129 [Aspergillus violaceofuscus CBS 115571]|uniref:RING-type domain-containing protein n=1 Tax=Aspergillus violaceofuscus (strain CBS 115571) TaxID=1450538 RepID=A0A2V5H4I2_ASPV1|nr:hypothetical protein BO99DRAFT_210129 [Aspergillus violaceofuscus CBS 115571]